MLDTPILFLIFNRPDTTQRVFNRIREIQPKKLYVAADGPRAHKAGEAERCEQARAIIRQVDWPCEVKTLFRTENLGCKQAIFQGISWFFEQEEMGIILEDDCLPGLSFFPFCEELLLRYKDDQRIGHIGGHIETPYLVAPELSYDFSFITHIWGWATWRRVWQNFDLSLPFWEQEKAKRDSLFCNTLEKIYCTSAIPDALYNRHGLNTWDYAYAFFLRTQHHLSIYPTVNMVENIGVGDPNATHTHKPAPTNYIYPQSMAFPLHHPRYIMRNHYIETRCTRNRFSFTRLFRYILNMISHEN